MVVGILQLELTIDSPASVKDKRKVVSSLKDRLHQNHQVSVAEVDRQDDKRTAVLGLSLVSADVAHARSILDKIVNHICESRGYVLADHRIEILSGQ